MGLTYAIIFVDIQPNMDLYFRISTVAAGLVVGIFNYLMVIGKVLETLCLTFDEVSKGNLKVECKIRSKDEIGKIAEAVDQMIDES
ncbi:HAMP domain-containing protein [Tepidibacillus marianensis]|uniref:HAMP domain-containing protein n=1 Tax=Tepidibacillus marianensis TaxID=3131995 RepID=UPI0030CF6BFE